MVKVIVLVIVPYHSVLTSLNLLSVPTMLELHTNFTQLRRPALQAAEKLHQAEKDRVTKHNDGVELLRPKQTAVELELIKVGLALDILLKAALAGGGEGDGGAGGGDAGARGAAG